MKLNRREFVTGAAGMASVAPGILNSAGGNASPTTSDLAGVRADFPWAASETYLNSALEHPINVYSARAMEKYISYLTNGSDAGRESFENSQVLQEVRQLFAELIQAKPSEIAFVPNTQAGENLVIDGMGIQASGGNVVTNDLHYGPCLFNYRMRQKSGLDVRIVKHRDWQIDIRDMERVVDRKTKLIAIALVSNINGYHHNVKAISDLAHAHGAYLYADVIQMAGAVPIDVGAMGIDFLACSAYKWLMGGDFGYLYVREELQGTVLKPTQFGGLGISQSGALRYQISTANRLGCACTHESLQYIHKLGVPNIKAHVKPLTDRLQKELPVLGYPSITPKDNESPIVTFLVKDSAAVRTKLQKAKILVTLRSSEHGGQMRVSPSVFNNLADMDRLIEALG